MLVTVLIGNNHPVEVEPYLFRDKYLVDIPLNNHYLTPHLPLKVLLENGKIVHLKPYSWTIKGPKPSITLHYIKE